MRFVEKRLTLIILFVFWLGVPLSGAESSDLSERVIELRLSNGMKVLLVERHASPSIACQIMFRAGSARNPDGKEGLARLLGRAWLTGPFYRNNEIHRMLEDSLIHMDALDDAERTEQKAGSQASPTADKEFERLGEEIKRILFQCEARRYYEESGAAGVRVQVDADSMRLAMRLPSWMLEPWTRIESDRMRDTLIAGFYHAREEIARETNRTMAFPKKTLLRELYGTAYEDHPYRRIGFATAASTKNVSRQDALAFKKKYCTPANAVVVIVGHLDPAEAINMVEQYFGAIPASVDPTFSELPQSQERRERIEAKKVQSDYGPEVAIGYYRPPNGTKDEVVLDLIDEVLSSSVRARLYQNLVKPGIALFAGTYSGPGARLPSLFVFEGRPVHPHTANDLVQAWEDEVAALSESPLEPLLLERAKRRIMASFHRGLASNTGLLERLLDAESAYGDWKILLHYQERLEAVTQEDVQRVAQTYLGPDMRMVVELVTGEKEESQP